MAKRNQTSPENGEESIEVFSVRYVISGLKQPAVIHFKQSQINLSNLEQEELAKLYQDGCQFIKCIEVES